MNYGVVAEFNPFHNGHRALLSALKADGASAVVAVMSESFVQRGEPACAPVPERVRAALENGVDVVLSLPLPYAVASAEKFAFGGVAALDAFGSLDAIAFGSECGDAELLQKVAASLESEELHPLLENRLAEGLSFPTARQKALAKLYGEGFAAVLRSPNDLLGVEYCKALRALGSPLSVRAVKREGVAHDAPRPEGEYLSGSAIRARLPDGDWQSYVPDGGKWLREAIAAGRAPASAERIESAVLTTLRRMAPADFALLPDVTEGLEHRLYAAVRSETSVKAILDAIKTKRYTYSRLRRIVLCAYLGVTRADVPAYPPYIRVLGFRRESGGELLKQAKEKATLPLVTRFADVQALGGEAERLFALECRARDLYGPALPAGEPCGREMSDRLILV